MNQVVTKGKVPIKIWTDDADATCIEQAVNLANLPFTFKHIVLLPDTHAGYGMPIGGVLATENIVIPNAVGVDIGCGMLAAKTNIKVADISTAQLKTILSDVRKAIPVGFTKHEKRYELPPVFVEAAIKLKDFSIPGFEKELENAQFQIGTLGGGNHFIEFQTDETGHLWVMVHSGSRHLGLFINKYYNNKAKELNAKWKSEVPLEWDLAFLPLDSDEGQEYFEAMNACLTFAKFSRFEMINKILFILCLHLGNKVTTLAEGVHCHHNYASIENHFGKNVVVHRKGAISAKNGELGVIPGTQGTTSYIVRGLGNPLSFMSSSHGAGRVLSRSKAKQELSLEKEQALLDSKGVMHSIRSISDLDEAPGAYKDIDIVMENQKDLVEIITKLTPIAVIKG